MSEEIKHLLLRIFDLSCSINPKSTRKETTGNAPTVIMDFSGQSCYFELSIFSCGWSPYLKPDFQCSIFLDAGWEKNKKERLRQCISKLESVCNSQFNNMEVAI